MAYTEIQKRNGNEYYYRVISIRNESKISKKKIYLGKGLSNHELLEKECNADKKMKSEKILKNIENIKSKIIDILKRNNIKKAGIFGSYARGEQKKNSDVDILVELGKPMGFAFVGIQLELENKLKKKVDLITYNSIYPLLREGILNDEVRIL